MAITEKWLDARFKRLSSALKLPPYPQVGSLVWDRAYNRHKISQISNEGGGEHELSGYMTKAEADIWLSGAIAVAEAHYRR